MKTKGQRQSKNIEVKPTDTHRPPNNQVSAKPTAPFVEDSMSSAAGLDKMDSAMEKDQWMKRTRRPKTQTEIDYDFFKHTTKDNLNGR